MSSHVRCRPLPAVPIMPGWIVPPEILETIFSKILERGNNTYVEGNPILRKEEMTTLLQVSQVCRYWRQIALGCSRLWAKVIYPDFQSSLFLEELIKRARSIPLTVESDCDSGTRSSRLSTRFHTPRWLEVLKAARRIQNLSVTFDLERGDEIWPLQDLVMKAAPLLQSCHLYCKSYVGHPYPHARFGDLGSRALPLFGGSAKELRCLSLHSCLLSPRADFSGLSLTHLEIDLSGFSTFALTLPEWLSLLNNHPLEFLTLSGFRFRHAMAVSARDLREVTLPYLKSIYLEGGINDCGDLFGALVLPSTCSVVLEVDQSFLRLTYDGLQAGLTRLLTQWDKHNGSPHVYHWTLETSRHFFRVQLGDANDQNIIDRLYTQFTIQCRIYDVPLRYPLTALLATLTSSPVIQREAILRFGHGVNAVEDPFIIWHLVYFLSAFSNATSLVLPGVFLENIVPCILFQNAISTTEAKENKDPILLPNLKQIALTRPTLDSGRLSLPLFCLYLEWRTERRKGIPKVFLAYPNMKAVPSGLEPKQFFAEELVLVDESQMGELATPVCPRCDCS